MLFASFFWNTHDLDGLKVAHLHKYESCTSIFAVQMCSVFVHRTKLRQHSTGLLLYMDTALVSCSKEVWSKLCLSLGSGWGFAICQQPADDCTSLGMKRPRVPLFLTSSWRFDQAYIIPLRSHFVCCCTPCLVMNGQVVAVVIGSFSASAARPMWLSLSEFVNSAKT